MSFFIYNKGLMGFPEASRFMTGVHLTILEDDIERYFTKKGFFYQITKGCPSLADILNDKISLVDDSRLQACASAVHICPKGSISQLDFIKDLDQPYRLDIHSLPVSENAIYMLHDKNRDEDGTSITAGLATWKGEKDFQKKMDKFYLQDNRKIHWFTMEEIQKKISESKI